MGSQSVFLLALWLHRVASVSQLAVLLKTSQQMVRRWVRKSDVRIYAGIAKQGRPEQWITLRGTKADTLLHDWQVTALAVEVVRLVGSCGLNHAFPDGSVPGIVPDLTFVLTHAGKSCLFFVEMDMGTEPLRRAGIGTDVARKLIAYRQLRVTNGYHSVGGEHGSNFHGFRLLLVANDEKRASQLSRLARALIGGDFVWVTDWQSACSAFGGLIWARGGRMENKGSILGSLAGIAKRDRSCSDR